MKINTNMKFNEILVKNILNKYVFDNNLIGGDNQILKLPDLYTRDKQIGIEVTMCELDIDFCINELKRKCSKFIYDYEKCFQIRNKYERKEMFSRLRNQLNQTACKNNHIFELKKSIDGNIEIFVNQEVINIGFVPYIFAKMYESKLKKLNHGNYDGVVSKNLVISSLLRDRNSDNAKMCFYMYDMINSMFIDKFFDKTYLLYRRGIFVFGKDKIEQFIKINKNELKKIYDSSLFEYKNLRQLKKNKK